jgi:hypothetical protein
MRPLSWPIFLSLAFAGACIFISADEHAARFDQDGDGVSWPDDCDDTNPAVADDCDVVPGLDTVDDDGDGFSEADGDCDDTNANLSPSDDDGDGYSTCDGDCNDADSSFFPVDTDGDGEEDYCNWLDLSVGRHTACALKPDHSLVCWGSNNYGQLDVPEAQFKDVSVGKRHACGVTVFNELICWGDYFQETGVLFPPNGQFVSVTSGSHHSCALSKDGEVACWGKEDRTEENPENWYEDFGFESISAGEYYTCGIVNWSDLEGALGCWGEFPEDIPSSWGKSYQQVSAGRDLLCALGVDQIVECWSDNQEHNPAGTPEEAAFLAVSTGDKDACGITVEGSLICWGEGEEKLTDVPTGTFVLIGIGGRQACAVSDAGMISCWGDTDGEPPGNPEAP